MTSKVCVIIPAYNEEEVIGDCLAGLDRQTYENFEVFVIDDASQDRTKEIVESYVRKNTQRFRLFEFGKVGPGKARNLAALETKADILAFTDADCIPSPIWLEELLKGFNYSESIGSTGGPHLAPPQSSEFQIRLENFFKRISFLTDFYKTKNTKVSLTAHNPLCNVAYRRDVFIRLKGFREDLFPGEDVEIDQRVRNLGYQISYNPTAIVFHHRPESIEQWRKVMHAYGRAQGKLTREAGPKRLLQWVGLTSFAGLFLLGWYSVLDFGLNGAFLFLAFCLVWFKFRPDSPSTWSIVANAFQWFNGFLQGFVTKRSDPPGFNPLALSERLAKLQNREPKDK